MRIIAQRTASVMGFRDPAAKGAIVRGTRAADPSLIQILAIARTIESQLSYRSKVQ